MKPSRKITRGPRKLTKITTNGYEYSEHQQNY